MESRDLKARAALRSKDQQQRRSNLPQYDRTPASAFCTRTAFDRLYNVHYHSAQCQFHSKLAEQWLLGPSAMYGYGLPPLPVYTKCAQQEKEQLRFSWSTQRCISSSSPHHAAQPQLKEAVEEEQQYSTQDAQPLSPQASATQNHGHSRLSLPLGSKFEYLTSGVNIW